MNETAIALVGGVTADPVDRTTGGGKPWVTFDLASTPRTMDQTTKEWKDGTLAYWPCTANGRVAQQVLAGISKGDQVVLVGQVGQRNWTDKDTGKPRSRMEVRVLAVGVQPRAPQAEQGSQPQARNDEPWGAGGSSQSYNDESPF